MFIKSKNKMINLTTWAWTDVVITTGAEHDYAIVAFFRGEESSSQIAEYDTEEEAKKILDEIWDALKRNENFLDIDLLDIETNDDGSSKRED